MNITIIQTSDAIFYYGLLTETSRSFRSYCASQAIRYESFVGLKRGDMPWHATYNRIYMLKEMLDRKVDGWVLYADADAMIVNQDFDLRRYLEDRNGYAGIFSGYLDGREPVAINAGGFAINLSHPVGAALVLDYWRRVEAISDHDFDSAVYWEVDIEEDQHMLHIILKDYVTRKNCGDVLFFERQGEGAINEGPFIKQLLRAGNPNWANRIATARSTIDQTLGDVADARAAEGAGIYIPAAHPRLATGCGVKDGVISSQGRAGVLMFGPYIPLAPGEWTGRIYGEARVPAGGSPLVMLADIACSHGTRILAQRHLSPDRGRKGLLAEMDFQLSEAVSDLEMRLVIDGAQDIVVHAIQLVRR